jgi:hypothetical protein
MQRTYITQMVLETIAEQLDKQDIKGFKKYGKTLDKVHFDTYDWNEMAMEELADCVKYLMMENFKLKRIIGRIRSEIQ